MKKSIIFLVVAAALFSGCSVKSVDGTMCDKIGKDRADIEIPKECRKYSEKEAANAMKSPKQKAAESRKDVSEGDLKLIDKDK